VTPVPATVTITRARHPLQGRSLRVLGGMRRHGVVELLLELPDGGKSLVPAAWTNAHPPIGGGTLSGCPTPNGRTGQSRRAST
jgi:hypothetical protein